MKKLIEKYNLKELSDRENKALACILGFILGDAKGLFYEDSSAFHDYDRWRIAIDKGAKSIIYSDDTALSLCLMKSLCDNHSINPTNIMKNMKLWNDKELFKSLDGDIGLTCLKAILAFEKGLINNTLSASENERGNGSLMRVFPLALCFKDKSKMLENTFHTAILTHKDPVPTAASLVYNSLLHELIHGYSKDFLFSKNSKLENSNINKWMIEQCLTHTKGIKKPFLSFVIDKLPIFGKPFRTINPLEFGYKEIVSYLKTDIPTYSLGKGYCISTLKAALFAINHRKEDTVISVIDSAISIGNDTDTTAALAGALAGAYFGLDSSILNNLEKVELDETAIYVIEEFLKLKL